MRRSSLVFSDGPITKGDGDETIEPASAGGVVGMISSTMWRLGGQNPRYFFQNIVSYHPTVVFFKGMLGVHWADAQTQRLDGLVPQVAARRTAKRRAIDAIHLAEVKPTTSPLRQSYGEKKNTKNIEKTSLAFKTIRLKIQRF